MRRSVNGGSAVDDSLERLAQLRGRLDAMVQRLGPEGYDEVVMRGDVEGRVFTAFWARDGHVVAGMQVNDWDAMDAVRDVVESGAGVADLDERLA